MSRALRPDDQDGDERLELAEEALSVGLGFTAVENFCVDLEFGPDGSDPAWGSPVRSVGDVAGVEDKTAFCADCVARSIVGYCIG